MTIWIARSCFCLALGALWWIEGQRGVAVLCVVVAGAIAWRFPPRRPDARPS